MIDEPNGMPPGADEDATTTPGSEENEGMVSPDANAPEGQGLGGNDDKDEGA